MSCAGSFMTINNPTAHLESLWDWAVLDGCFGAGKIKPTDVDGMVERNGHFLYLETKGFGVLLKQGQEIAIRNRVRDGISTYIVVWGSPGVPQQMQIFYPAHISDSSNVVDCDLPILRNVCSQWYQWVSANDWRTAIRRAVELT
jgi:hypothetical protein